MGNRSFTVSALALAVAATALPAQADEHRGEGRGEGRQVEPRHAEHEYHGRIERFHEHDWGLWHGGHWERREHDGRLGWWWLAGGLWYLYPQPVYPWPNPYEPPVYTAPPVTEVAPAPPPPPQPRVWYFCASSNAYYPYTPSCPEGWRTVPATPQR